MDNLFDWDALNLGDLEDPEQTKIRLDAIHRQMLEQKGISIRPEKNSPGFNPTPYQARQVSVMSALGLDSKDIALVLNVEEKLVNLYYRRELKVSHAMANAMVARVALSMAMSGRFPDMTKFWLTSQANWKVNGNAANADGNKKNNDTDTAKDRLRTMIASQPNLSPASKK